MTFAGRIVAHLKDAGVRRLFGMPGGGANADLIQAAGCAGLPFSLAHTETAAAFMASAQAEITRRPGACLATLGPGAASVMNGVAHAWLDRVPLLVLTDCHSGAQGMDHQRLDQQAMFQPVVKWSARLGPGNVDEVMPRAIELACAPPRGPVHLDVSAVPRPGQSDARSAGGCKTDSGDLAAPRRPVFLLGLGAREPSLAAEVRRLCERFGIPALVTYKAKGVVPDRHPWFGGVLTNGELEREILERADRFYAVGLDRVELLTRPWRYPQPLVEGLPAALRPTGWTAAEVAALVQRQRVRMTPCGTPDELLPHRVVELVAEAYPGARVTVDAGAHMFPVMTFWPAEEPCGALISNGLATMGFGLPAAIGAALLDGSRPVVTFTGDGGLLMCVGELRTAARERLPLRIIVFDDSALSLIRIKQVRRKYRTDGVNIGEMDWCAVATGMGVTARRADSEESLRASLRETAGYQGPVLIAARIAARVYPEMMRALRGDA